MSNKPISLIHTPCKLCVFAEYEDNTQIGCQIGYLSTYQKNNIEILEVYDDEKNFYVINNKKCLGYRDRSWLDKHQDQDLSSVVKAENELKYICLIEITTNSTLDKIKQYIYSIINQDIKPKGILFYQNRLENHKVKNQELLHFMQNFTNTGIDWKIKNFIDKDMDNQDRFKATIASCPINRFYLLADTDNALPNNCIKNIQSYIDSGNSFGCINIDNNKFFSYISVQYCKNIRHIDLLSETSLHTKYETIS